MYVGLKKKCLLDCLERWEFVVVFFCFNKKNELRPAWLERMDCPGMTRPNGLPDQSAAWSKNNCPIYILPICQLFLKSVDWTNWTYPPALKIHFYSPCQRLGGVPLQVTCLQQHPDHLQVQQHLSLISCRSFPFLLASFLMSWHKR